MTQHHKNISFSYENDPSESKKIKKGLPPSSTFSKCPDENLTINFAWPYQEATDILQSDCNVPTEFLRHFAIFDWYYPPRFIIQEITNRNHLRTSQSSSLLENGVFLVELFGLSCGLVNKRSSLETFIGKLYIRDTHLI